VGLPALLVGMVAMVAGDVGAGRAAANAVCFGLGLIVVHRVRRAAWSPGPWVGALLCGALLVTLIGPGIDGVHRWIDIGPLSLNVSMLAAPLLLAVMAQSIARERIAAAIGIAVVVQLIHLLQPDAAQGTAFAVGAAVLLLAGTGRASAPVLVGAATVLALALATFARHDPLVPVAEVEGIVGLAREVAFPLGVLAVVTCALLAVPFLRAALIGRRSPERVVRAGHAAVGAYVLVQLLAPIALHVPVPVLGYGATTVLAYAAAFIAGLAMPRGRATRPRRAWLEGVEEPAELTFVARTG